MNQRKTAALALSVLLLAGCGAQPAPESDLRAEKLKRDGVQYTLADGISYSEWALTLEGTEEKPAGDPLFYDVSFLDEDTLLLNAVHQEENGIHSGIYAMELDGSSNQKLWEASLPFDEDGSFPNIRALGLGDGRFVMVEGDQFRFADSTGKITEEFSLAPIRESAGSEDFMFDHDFEKAVITVPSGTDEKGMPTGWELRQYDLRTAEYTVLETGHPSGDAELQAAGIQAIPIPMSYGADGSLLYRFFFWDQLEDGYGLISPEGEVTRYESTPEMVENKVGPSSFLGTTDTLICTGNRPDRLYQNLGLFTEEGYQALELPLEEDALSYVNLWWNLESPTAVFLENPMYGMEGQECTIRYGSYDPEAGLDIWLSHGSFLSEENYLDQGLPLMSILGLSEKSNRFGMAVAPDGSSIANVVMLDGQIYLTLLAQN